ncbi:MAG TPA: type II secretion system protein GspC [Steroidobacteraceae bacterium]|nr:type II secretion system protein GspC [Steroidobacteraceae bacterium]
MSAATWYEELKSGPGWSRLLTQRATQLVVGVLLIAVAIDCALILTRALSVTALPAAGSASARPVPLKGPVNPTLELATIVNAHLFGSAGAQPGSAAPQTTMPLILAGVIADKDPAKGQAIIGETAAAAKLFAVGAMISGGARLSSVYGDRVLLERNGRLETLMLPRTTAKAGGPAMPLTPPQSAAPAGALRDNATVLAGLVRVQPVYSQGKLTGYRIFPGGSHGASAFSQLGLRSGDLILAVNGTSLDDAARAMEVLQTLSSSASATITVSRNGQSQEVNLNLANLSTDTDGAATDTNVGTAGAEQSPGAMAGPMRGRFGGGNTPGAPSAPPPGQAANGSPPPGDAAPAANDPASSAR